MSDRPCKTCKHYQPEISLETLWGLHKSAAHEDARCGHPQFPTVRYSISQRQYVLLMNRSARNLPIDVARRIDLLCAESGDHWEPAVKISRLTKAKNLFKRMVSRFRWKRASA